MINCVNCDKEILSGDIFMKLSIDMLRLIYDEVEQEEKFLVPDGPVRLKVKIYLCDNCSRNFMKLSSEEIAKAIVDASTGK